MGDVELERETEAEATAEVQMYTLRGCTSCMFARRLLRRRGVAFEELRGEGIPDFRGVLRRRTGSGTAPQILIDGEPIGGADSLMALDRSGALMPRIRQETFPAVVIQRRFTIFRRRYEVRVVEADGAVLATARAGSAEESETLATGLREEFQA